MTRQVDYYNATYTDFAADIRARIRSEAFGEDIGQNSWLTAEEQRRFSRKLGLTRHSHLLEVACGSGGPALFLARTIGLTVTGIDINEAGITAARAAATAAGLNGRAEFLCLDCGHGLPFGDGSFDAVQSIDSINHLAGRRALLAELHRVLRPGGMLLYTDPIIVTGPISSEEMAIRSSIGFFLFVPEGENELVLGDAGFKLVEKENVTANEVETSERWIDAREAQRDELIRIEGEETYEGTQKFFHAVQALASSGRLSRFMFLARRD